MTENLTAGQVKTRSLRGAKWILITNLIGLPGSFLISFFLGRTSAESLGVYALAQIFVGVVITFALFGAEATLRNFVPKVHDPTARGRLFFTYAVIVTLMLGGLLALFAAFPWMLEFFLEGDLDWEQYRFLAYLAAALVAANVFMGLAAGLLHLKAAAVARLAIRLLPLPVIALLYFIHQDALKDSAQIVIFGSLFCGYLLGAALCFVAVLRERRFRFSFGFYWPKGFAAFAWTSYLAALFSFFYGYFDRICMLQVGDLGTLGKYQAVISLTLLIEFIPNMMQTALIPTFSSLLAARNPSAFRRAYAVVYRNSVLLITTLGLLLIGLSREVLGLFGPEYEEYDYLLSLFCFANIIRSPSAATLSVLASMEINRFRIYLSLGQMAFQGIGTLLFLDRYGVLAIAGFKILAMIGATLIGNFYVIYRLKMANRVPLSFKAATAVGSAALVCRLWLVPEGWVGSAALASVAVLLFALASRVSPTEVRNVFAALFHGKEIPFWRDQDERDA
jgi:O-antigen/teichoic acid export membrane protein